MRVRHLRDDARAFDSIHELACRPVAVPVGSHRPRASIRGRPKSVPSPDRRRICIVGVSRRSETALRGVVSAVLCLPLRRFRHRRVRAGDHRDCNSLRGRWARAPSWSSSVSPEPKNAERRCVEPFTPSPMPSCHPQLGAVRLESTSRARVGQGTRWQPRQSCPAHLRPTAAYARTAPAVLAIPSDLRTALQSVRARCSPEAKFARAVSRAPSAPKHREPRSAKFSSPKPVMFAETAHFEG